MTYAGPVTRSKLEDVLPLTPLQEGLLFQTLFDSESEDLYVSQMLIDIEGPLKGGPGTWGW